MKIIIAASEAVPYCKTGGLADVTGALSREFRKKNEEVYLILPLYKAIKESMSLQDTGLEITVPMGNMEVRGRIFKTAVAYFIECDKFFGRNELYGTLRGDYEDNAARFIFFSRGVFEVCRALDFRPDVIHCHDWQTGLIPLYLKTLYRDDNLFKNTSTLFTIHNLGYQGLFPPDVFSLIDLDWEFFTPQGIEFYGKVNFLKAAIVYADLLSTVSSTYSNEICSTEFGFGLDGVLTTRREDLYGIINGIDYEEWDPLKDRLLPHNFDAKKLTGKRKCKRQLVNTLSLDDDTRPVIGIISRISAQKGIDLILAAIDEVVSVGFNFVLLGKGEESYQQRFLYFAKAYKGRVAVKVGFEEELAHLIYAGADFMLIPSRYEPCGLSQLIAMRYGSVPIARKTGGLADTVQDFNPMTSEGNGFLFSDYTPAAMQDAVKRALHVYVDKQRMSKIISNAMNADFSWARAIEEYTKLYVIAINKRKGIIK